MSPLSNTRPAITNFRMLGSTEPGFLHQPNFMPSVHATHNASLYFFYLTCEFSSHYAPYVLVYACCYCHVPITTFSCCATHTVLSLWAGFDGVACHLHASLCKKEWRTGRRMILSAVHHGVAKEFIQFCACLRVNKRSCITLHRIRKALARKQWPHWLNNFSKEAYYVWPGMRRMALPQAAVPGGESTIAVMRADRRKLVHAGLTKPSKLSIADRGALQFRKLWRRIVRRGIVVWAVNWWHTQFQANLVKPNVCLDVPAIAMLHTTPLLFFSVTRVCMT